jgi:hypothetical protein
MRRRLFITVGVLLAVVAALAFVKYRQIRAAIEGGGYVPPPESVTTVVAGEAQWGGVLNAIACRRARCSCGSTPARKWPS